MSEIPCVVFLPEDREKRIMLLQKIFGSKIKLEILERFCVESGVEKRLYQQDLIESLPYSNKTIIAHIQELVSLGVLSEGMEKRKKWRKYLEVERNMEWLVLLLHDPKRMKDEKLRDSIKEFASLYLKHLRSLIERYGLDEREMMGHSKIKT
ncbi:MAG: hypothetical protein B6U86_02475 [Candidatus Altiarchaeales archaeon ex4484_43]|nr:MAG: hypothetical protein B6U86_02475 [Candidatus Altiarchaeales archaeon ex4484_43]